MKELSISCIKVVVLIALVINISYSIRLNEHVDEHDYVWVSEDKSQWIGYLPQCEYICTQKEEG